MDFKLDELQRKIEAELPSVYLGNYNPEKRREALLANIDDYLEEYQETKDEPGTE